MKILLSVLSLIVVLGAVGCGSDDGPDPSVPVVSQDSPDAAPPGISMQGVGAAGGAAPASGGSQAASTE